MDKGDKVHGNKNYMVWGQDVNRWSLGPIQCQQESPVWGAVKKETLFNAGSLTGIQLNYGALSGGPADRPPSAWTAPLHLRGKVRSEPEES